MGVEAVSAGGPRAVGRSGRRRANVAGGRDRRHYVKVSAGEEARLVELASARGITVARLLVESALAGGAESAGAAAAVAAELAVLSRAVGRVGVNVNQIARVTNATGEVQDATTAALRAVEVVAARLGAVLAGLAGPGRRRVAG
ncbi:MAG TPA: plasmid mobilization relaxosome protein MobC [Sporichthyaceae bacterium]|nr:plasmid mobilization relaxosome protein MobC [Sporichthyaceae bacterium]